MVIIAEKPVAELQDASQPPKPADGFGGWCVKVNETWTVRRWFIGGLSSTVWSGAAGISGGAMTLWPTWQGTWFVALLGSCAIGLFGAITSSVAGKTVAGAREGERRFASRTRLRLAAQAINSWLNHQQATLGNTDYRITILLCLPNGPGHALKPIFRDRNHPIANSANPTVSGDDRSKCQGVAGQAWFERAVAEVASTCAFAANQAQYLQEMEVDLAFAQTCRRQSRYYLGIPLLYAGHPMGVLTVDSVQFGCLVKVASKFGSLTGKSKAKHAEKRIELEKASDYLALMVQDFFEAGGVSLGNNSA